MTRLKWGDIETNAIAFSKRWKDCKGDEKQEAQTFEKELMSVFGVDWREGLHEHRVTNAEGIQNYVDYILPGKILIEMKSKGESLIRAYNQAISYFSFSCSRHPLLSIDTPKRTNRNMRRARR